MKCMVAVVSAFLVCGCASAPSQTESAPAAVALPQGPVAASAGAEPAGRPAASKASAPVSPVAAPRRRADAPAPSGRPAGPPPLDLKSLEQQLKDTAAIGFLTKLSLKNEVDDLLAQFRGVYAGPRSASVAPLRKPFDMLLMKVMALLQDRDPALAGSIHASREALWGVLADREKFQNLA